jgi:hypothetical protein
LQGEERTKANTEKLKKDMAHTVSSFDKLDFSGKDESLFLYGGEDLAEISAINQGTSVGNFIEFGPRERKQRVSYNEAAAYAAQYNAAGVNVPGRRAGAAKIKAPTMNDFQFYNKARIEELYAKENSFVQPRRDLQIKLKEAKVKEAKEQKKFVKQRSTELQEADPSLTGLFGVSSQVTTYAIWCNPQGCAEGEATAAAEVEWASKESELESSQLEAEILGLDLTPEEKKVCMPLPIVR